jgi:2,3,4,5-tetrahydropyridine-2-carboxylate N-succinyltransferase
VDELARRGEALAAVPAGRPLPKSARATVDSVLGMLEEGSVRAASRSDDGVWSAVQWVKRCILLAFRIGRVVRMGSSGGALHFLDKDTLPTRSFALTDRVRIVPGGSTVRHGAYLAPGVVCMPPMYVNVGAYVDEGTMVDSHALVGSCAQVGKRVHLSAAAQIGGVLEPVNAAPVVIEDDVVVGGNCGVYEGTVVRAGAVLAAGVLLTRGTPVFDLVRNTVYRAADGRPLEIPARAVVVPGARQITGGWGGEQRLSLQTPVIVKYRDEKTDLSTELELLLR